MQLNAPKGNDLKQAELVRFDRFLDSVGLARTTGWRWRKAGWIKTITIAGKPYITRDAIQEFLQRARAGEYAGLSPKEKPQ